MRFVLLLAATLALAGPASGQWDGWDYQFDQEIKPWSEMQVQMPQYPADDSSLIPLDVGAATPHRFFVDAKSVSVANDGVVRYTLVIKSAGGATNVSFEGIRCVSREQKYYAIGRADKTWVRARNPQWRPIARHQVNAHHITLYDDYMCRGKIMMETAEKVVEALRRGPPRAEFGG